MECKQASGAVLVHLLALDSLCSSGNRLMFSNEDKGNEHMAFSDHFDITQDSREDSQITR